MSDLYNEFENRFTDKWFSAGWVEVAPKEQVQTVSKKDLTTLQGELDEISDSIEQIAQKQLRLANLAKLYNS